MLGEPVADRGGVRIGLTEVTAWRSSRHRTTTRRGWGRCGRRRRIRGRRCGRRSGAGRSRWPRTTTRGRPGPGQRVGVDRDARDRDLGHVLLDEAAGLGFEVDHVVGSDPDDLHPDAVTGEQAEVGVGLVGRDVGGGQGTQGSRDDGPVTPGGVVAATPGGGVDPVTALPAHDGDGHARRVHPGADRAPAPPAARAAGAEPIRSPTRANRTLQLLDTLPIYFRSCQCQRLSSAVVTSPSASASPDATDSGLVRRR